MKRKRVALILGAGTLLAAFSVMGYVAYLKQQTALLLAARKPPANAERYATLQKALYSSPDAKPPAASELPTKLPEGDPASAPLLAPLMRAEKVFARLSDDFNTPGEWQAIFDELLYSKPVSQWTAADWARLNAFLDTHRDLLAEIRALAAEDGPLYPLDLSKGHAMELPHLAPTRTLARLLRADALARAHAGDLAGAAADLVAGLQLGARIGGEPTLISQLVGSAIDGIVYDAIGEAFPEGQIPPELAAQLAQHIYSANSSGGYSEAMLEERHMGLDFIGQVMESDWDDTMELGTMQYSGVPSWQWSLYSSPLARPWQHMDAHAYDRIMSGFQDTLGLPYYEARPLIEALTREVEGLPSSRLFTRMQLPAMFGFHQAIARDQARQQIAQLGIALESHAREHGAYPSELGAIQGQANGTSIIDPFTGAPFHYVTNGNGFSLYSVGRDLEDDGGRQGDRDGDIVWRGEETPEPARGRGLPSPGAS